VLVPTKRSFEACSGLVLPLRGEGLIVEAGGRRLLGPIDIEIGGGGTLVILGPNGAGKSLLVRVLAGLVTPTSGRVTWAGSPPDRQRVQQIGFVFQRPVLLRRSVRANIEYALAVAGLPRAERKERALAQLARARLERLAQVPARLLSGGEQQLLSIVRALAAGPEVLVLDEPTSHLDPAATAAIESLVRSTSAEGTRVVLITHDLAQAHRLGDEIAFLYRGRVLERRPQNEFFDSPRTTEAQAFVRGEIVL
jgi:tungstate transport system ATP-binding protein